MLNLYEEYETQQDREDAVMLESAEIAMDRSILAVDTCNAIQALNMRDAECRLVMESGDVLSLANYYEEATEDTNEKKQGLLRRAWEAIVKFLENIKEKLFGKGPKADENEEYEVPKSFLDQHQKLKAAVEAVKKFFSNPGVKVAVAAISAIAVALGIAAHNKNKSDGGATVKVKGSKLNQLVEEKKKLTESLKGGIKGFFGKSGNNEKESEVQSNTSKLSKRIKESIMDLFGVISKEDAKREKIHAFQKGKELGSGRAAAKKAEEDRRKREAQERLDKYKNKGRELGAYSMGDPNYDYDQFTGESTEDDDFLGDLYAEDAGDVDDIAALLESL